MIEHVAVVWQGPNDIGFIAGLRDRLGCAAKLVRARRRGNKYIAKHEAKKIVVGLMGERFDLIIRLTDSDAEDWRQVQRVETDNWPDQVRSQLVCGVAEGTIEVWLALSRGYLEKQFGIPANEILPRSALIGRVKAALRKSVPAGDYADRIRHFVADAPKEVMRQWLTDASFRDFYVQCRDAAIRDRDCKNQVHDELKVEVAL